MIENAGCLHQVCYVEGELLSGDLSNGTQAVAVGEKGELPVTIRNLAFIDPPAATDRVFTLVIDRPDYDIEWLKGATLFTEWN
ncbi:MAG: hypothetical protein ACREXT_14490 [Gammaproteobacteria bacterium]